MKHPRAKGKDSIIDVNLGMKNKDAARIKVLEQKVEDLQTQLANRDKRIEELRLTEKEKKQLERDKRGLEKAASALEEELTESKAVSSAASTRSHELTLQLANLRAGGQAPGLKREVTKVEDLDPSKLAPF